VTRSSLLALILFSSSPTLLSAKESVCLTSGFCLAVDSHMQQGQKLVCRNGRGTLEFAVDQISQIVALPDPSSRPTSSAVSEDPLSRAAIRQGSEPDFVRLVRSVARIESGLRQDAVSAKGAIGLMQLMPDTASILGVDARLPDQNAEGGAKFLREMLLRYHYDSTLALAAYNAGPGAVDRYKGVPPYRETRRYIIKVLQEYYRQQRQEQNDPKALPAADDAGKVSPAQKAQRHKLAPAV
jgi:Transglycosylase SLT domain